MKTKKLLKKISLGVVGIASIGAIAFGVCKIVQFCKNDSKTLSLDYSVGALTDEGKYQEDECKLYTKKAFACEGLRVTFDFDAEVNGQFYFYDINDKYLSKSDVITEGSSVSVPLNGAYARAVVIPTNDEDGTISFTEKYKYGSQMQVKVNKEAESNVKKKFKVINSTLFEVKREISLLEFKYNYSWDCDFNKYVEQSSTGYNTTFNCLLDVSNYKQIVIDSQSFSFDLFIILYDDDMNYIGKSSLKNNEQLNANVKNGSYCIFNMHFNDEDMAKNPLSFLQLLKFEK